MRGNGKVIQELEALFRGAGWNVIKVIWGREWDELLARDVDGVLVNKMNTTVDGEFQKYAVESGAYIREHFFGPDPRLQQMVEHLTDEDLQQLPRGGHDYRKLYAAYKLATEHQGQPDRDPGQDGEGLDARRRASRRATPRTRSRRWTRDELKPFRDRLLPRRSPTPSSRTATPPYYHPGTDSPEYEYMMARRQRARRLAARARRARQAGARSRRARSYADLLAGTGEKVQASTTTAFARLLRNCCAIRSSGAASCRSSPTRRARSGSTRCSAR